MRRARLNRSGLQKAGYTLAELLVGMSILGLLLGLAAPGFGRLLREAEMSRAVNQLVTDVHRARQSAQLRARTVTLCASANGRACDNGLDWSDGWLLAAAASGEVGSAAALSRASGTRAVGIRVVANRRAFEFRPFTLRDTNGSLWFCDLRGKARERRVVISPTGRPRLAFEEDSQTGVSCSS